MTESCLSMLNETQTKKDEEENDEDCIIVSTSSCSIIPSSNSNQKSSVVIDLTSEPDIPKKPFSFSTPISSKTRSLKIATGCKNRGNRSLRPSLFDSDSPAPSFIPIASLSVSLPITSVPSNVRPLHGFVKHQASKNINGSKKRKRRLERNRSSSNANHTHNSSSASADSYRISLPKLRKSIVVLARYMSSLRHQLNSSIRPRARISFTNQLRQAEDRKQLLTEQLFRFHPTSALGIINGAFGRSAAMPPASEPPRLLPPPPPPPVLFSGVDFERTLAEQAALHNQPRFGVFPSPDSSTHNDCNGSSQPFTEQTLSDQPPTSDASSGAVASTPSTSAASGASHGAQLAAPSLSRVEHVMPLYSRWLAAQHSPNTAGLGPLPITFFNLLIVKIGSLGMLRSRSDARPDQDLFPAGAHRGRVHVHVHERSRTCFSVGVMDELMN